MTDKILGVVLAALWAGVVVLACIIGAYFMASFWGILGLCMLAEKLNKHYQWTDHFMSLWRERKKQKDLYTFMTDRHTGKDRVKK